VRVLAKSMVLLMPNPGAYATITALLLRLQGSNSRYDIAKNRVTTFHVKLQNRAACSVENLTHTKRIGDTVL